MKNEPTGRSSGPRSSFGGGGPPFAAQEGPSQTMKLLTLKKAQLSLEKTKGDFDRSLKLKEQGLTSEQDFALVRTAYLQAQVDYQQALINFMGSEARISVASAVKFQDAGGKKFVRVTLRYSSKELKELARLNINAEDLFPLDFMKEIKDVSVSLKSEGKIVSDPYEKTIASLPLETQQDVTFQLLKDVESLDIDVFYSGKERNDLGLPPEGRLAPTSSPSTRPSSRRKPTWRARRPSTCPWRSSRAKPTSSSSRSRTCPTRSTTSSATRRPRPGCPRSSSPRASPR